ncbi:acyltransferase family protein [Pseudomonas alliivorans]|nr:acyltransferase family protein [Pseudomonas alliivorans]
MTTRTFDASVEASSKPIHLTYRPDIDGLRAFAVMIVVLFHAFADYLPGGFIGVDVFFVISGFLISSIIFKNLDRGTFSFVDFYVRRIKRILPVLILVLTACYVYGWFKMFPAEFMALGKHIAAGAVFGSNFALWHEAGYFDAASTTKPLLHLWSLAIEEQFYLVWPILAIIAFRFRASFFWINVAIVLASFGIGIYLIDQDRTAAFYSPASRFWEIGVGSLIAWVTFKHAKTYRAFADRLRLDNVLSIAGSAFLLFALFYFDEGLSFPGYWAVIPAAGAAMVILAGPQALVNRMVLGSRLAVWVGLISYPIYLWHWPLLTAIHLESAPIVVDNLTLVRWIAVVLSIALGWLSFVCVEKPVKRLTSDKLAAATIFSLLMGAGLVGLTTNLKDGFASRVPENLRELGAITNVYAYFEFGEGVRVHTCHISNPMPEGFSRPASCFSDKRPLLMLWGDSYAAALYPGIAALSEQGQFGIEQITVGNAPPFFDATKRAADNRTLLTDNLEAISVAASSKPDVILLSWMVSGGNALATPEASVEGLASTVARIREVTPSSKIVMVGPVPQWESNLSQTVVNYLKTQPLGSKMKEYTTFGLRPEPKEWDRYFAEHIPRLGVRYISAYQAMCNEDGCLTNVGPKNTDLTTVDTGHLTKSGSEFLVSRIGQIILEQFSSSDGNVTQR